MKQNLLGLGICALLLLVLFAGAYVEKNGFALPSPYEGYANKIIATCKGEPYPPSCYDKEIPKLMDRGLTMEESFKVTSIIQTKVSNYFFCHVLGHNLSAKETAKDPAQWTSVVARCPTGMCSNGCLHGAAQERFRDDVLSDEQIRGLMPTLSDVCETSRNFTGLERASCYHAMGHLTMYISGANIQTATDVCTEIGDKGSRNFTTTCYEGAYMQIFQPLEPEDFVLVKDIAPTSQEEAQAYCSTFAEEYRAACSRESWPLYRADLMEEPGGLERFCSLVPGERNEKRCYTSMFFVLTSQFGFVDSKVLEICERTPEKWRGQCFADAAARYVETDYQLTSRAVGLCKIAETQGFGETCYNQLLFYSWFNFHAGSKEVEQLCKQLPEPWQTKCMNGEGQDANRPATSTPK